MAGLTENIARFIESSSWSAMPPAALDKAKKVIADTFAVILAGAGSEVAPPLNDYVAQCGERGDCAILGTALKASPEIAALVNGTFGHALDYDDVLSMMPAHPSAVIIAACLARPPGTRLGGRALLEAYVVGIEVGARIGEAITVGHYNRGFHGTGTLGIFCALAARASLDRLDVATTRTAFGIGSSMASGVRRNFGTMVKPLHTGWAARSALAAVALARCGFTAAPDALEAKAGFFAAYGVAESDPQGAAARLGSPWVIVDPGIALKRFPCCYASHRGMDAVLRLRSELNFDADGVKRVICRMPPGGMRVLTYPRPVTGLEAKFSLEYSLAAGVLDGGYTLASFEDAAVNRREAQALLEKIECVEEARCAGGDALLETRSSGSRGFVEVEVELTDGRKQALKVERAPGHPERELSWDDLHRKFLDCAAHAGLHRPKAQRAFEHLTALEHCDDIDAIVTALVKT